MNKNKVKDKLEWDGETVKQTIPVIVKKHNPKVILDSLKKTRDDKVRFEESIVKLDENRKNAVVSVKLAIERTKELEPFEKKCVELQKEKLLLFIEQIKEECTIKAEKVVKENYDKDPEAHVIEHLPKMKYVTYQKLLATNKKIAENITAQIIISDLYDKPVFENPFKTTD